MKVNFIILVFIIVQLAESSHFRGGIITWKPVNPYLNTSIQNITVAITKRFYWRRQIVCSSNGTTLVGENVINFGKIQLDTLVYCTETSIIDNWYGGEKTDYINFNVSSSKYIEGVFESCCWISTILNGPDNGWQVRVRLNLTKRLDKNVINTSPVALMEPIKTLSANCDHQFKIDIADIDGDIVKCRWSELAKKECIDATCGPVQGIIA